MEYIVVSGYGSTGSSAVHSLLKNVDKIKGFDVEFKLFSAADGLLDLEHYVVEDWNYLKNGKAIQRFEALCDRLVNNSLNVYSYDKIFSDHFQNDINSFIRTIAPNKYTCGSSTFYLDERVLYMKSFRKYIFSIAEKLTNREMLGFCDISPSLFYEAVKTLLNEMFEADTCDGKAILLDQGLPPTQAGKINSFFDNGKMIIVDRDPRDVALDSMLKGKMFGATLRDQLDSDLYCRWFDKMHDYGHKVSDPNVLYLNFEDLVNNTHSTIQKIFEFCGIDGSEAVSAEKSFDHERAESGYRKWDKTDDPKWCSKQEWIEFCDVVKDKLDKYCIK